MHGKGPYQISKPRIPLGSTHHTRPQANFFIPDAWKEILADIPYSA